MSKQDKINDIISECHEQRMVQAEQIAYVLATVEWETNHTFDPVKEAYWLSEDWRKKNLRYYPYYGRGFPQLTWEENYQKYSGIIASKYEMDAPIADIPDLVANPDMALDPNISAFILVHGFINGTFTGRRIEQYIDAEGCDFFNARRCINGVDKASEIAQIAVEFLTGKEWDLPA